MADILSSLAAANGSHESFHSTNSHPAVGDTISQSPGQVQIAALQAAGLPVHDVDTFLNSPENQALLAEAVSRKQTSQAKQSSTVGSNSGSSGPVLLGGTKTSHNIKALNEICQRKGLQLEFEIEGDQSGFSGWVSVGGENITTDKKWPSKKEAKEALAGMAMLSAGTLEAKANATPGGSGQENWIGKLLEYHNAISPTQGPMYQDYAVGSFFACTCVIPGYPTPFGGDTVTFPNKKSARRNAAREAMQFLITAGLTEPDGSLKAKKKKAKLSSAVKIEKDVFAVQKATTYSQRVNDICPILGLSPPEYRINPLSANAPNMVSGAAYFRAEPLFPNPVGEVRNVFGKKSAKEECAKGVWQVLSELAKRRGLKLAETDEDVVMST